MSERSDSRALLFRAVLGAPIWATLFITVIKSVPQAIESASFTPILFVPISMTFFGVLLNWPIMMILLFGFHVIVCKLNLQHPLVYAAAGLPSVWIPVIGADAMPASIAPGWISFLGVSQGILFHFFRWGFITRPAPPHKPIT